jgi:hypothetical protein
LVCVVVVFVGGDYGGLREQRRVPVPTSGQLDGGAVSPLSPSNAFARIGRCGSEAVPFTRCLGAQLRRRQGHTRAYPGSILAAARIRGPSRRRPRGVGVGPRVRSAHRATDRPDDRFRLATRARRRWHRRGHMATARSSSARAPDLGEPGARHGGQSPTAHAVRMTGRSAQDASNARDALAMLRTPRKVVQLYGGAFFVQALLCLRTPPNSTGWAPFDAVSGKGQ